VTVDVRLLVYLKGADLTASTAFLTLRDKMGYADKLFGIKRFDEYAVSIESGEPAGTAEALKRLLATQSTYYNRNKHDFLLCCTWEGGELRDGVDEIEVERRLL